MRIPGWLKLFQITVRGPGLPEDPWKRLFEELAAAIEDASRYAVQDARSLTVTVPAGKWLACLTRARKRP